MWQGEQTVFSASFLVFEDTNSVSAVFSSPGVWRREIVGTETVRYVHRASQIP